MSSAKAESRPKASTSDDFNKTLSAIGNHVSIGSHDCSAMCYGGGNQNSVGRIFVKLSRKEVAAHCNLGSEIQKVHFELVHKTIKPNKRRLSEV